MGGNALSTAEPEQEYEPRKPEPEPKYEQRKPEPKYEPKSNTERLATQEMTFRGRAGTTKV